MTAIVPKLCGLCKHYKGYVGTVRSLATTEPDTVLFQISMKAEGNCLEITEERTEFQSVLNNRGECQYPGAEAVRGLTIFQEQAPPDQCPLRAPAASDDTNKVLETGEVTLPWNDVEVDGALYVDHFMEISWKAYSFYLEFVVHECKRNRKLKIDDVAFSGSLRWDGCVNLSPADVPLHFCGPEKKPLLGRMMDAIYALGPKIPNWDHTRWKS